MGQYYRVIIEKKGVQKYFDRTLDGSCTSAKLTEHSWWRNPFVNTICHLIHNKPAKVAWVGDYANDFEFYNNIWADDEDSINFTKLSEAQVALNDKYLVNHTKKQYINCNDYYSQCADKEGWCIHPLPILTCVGNGNGGGDYYGPCQEYVGIWCMDEVSVDNKMPKGYTKIDPVFKESWMD